MQIIHSSVAVEAAGILQAWRTGGFAALRTQAEWANPESGSLLDLERRDLLNAILEKIQETGNGYAMEDPEFPDVRMETCLNLLRHLGATQDY